MRNHRVETGVTHLDRALQGGLPLGSLTLLAGNPGTGKTILCGEFLHHGATLGEEGLYVSLAEGREAFLEYMARLGRDFTKPPAKDHLHVMDLVTVKEEGLDALVEMMIEHIDGHGIQRLVVDSFTALSNAFTATIDARVTLHILSKILAQTSCTTLLVTEVPTGTEHMGLGVEEFVSDGVIHLRRALMNGSTLRTLEIAKMRGTLTERPLSIFTLSHGFNVLPPFTQTAEGSRHPFTPTPDPAEAYSTGNPGLDSLIGPLRRGDTVYLELGDDVAPLVPALIAGTLRANFLAQGRGVLFMPAGGENVGRIAAFDGRFGLPQGAQRLLRIATASGNQGHEPAAIRMDPDSLQRSWGAWAEAERELTEETGEPTLKMIYVDSLQSNWAGENLGRLLDSESMRTRDAGGLLMLLSRPGDGSLRQHAGNLSHTHLRAVNLQGVILLQGVKPKTPLNALNQDDERGYPSYTLTPIY